MLTGFFLDNSSFILKFVADNNCYKRETKSNIFNLSFTDCEFSFS